MNQPGPILGIDKNVSRFKSLAKSAANLGAPLGANIILWEADIFSKETLLPIVKWVVCNPPFEDDLMKWILNLHAMTHRVNGTCTIIVPTRKAVAICAFLDEALEPKTRVTSWQTITDSGRQWTERKNMIEVSVISWVATNMKSNWQTTWNDWKDYVFQKSKREFDPTNTPGVAPS